MRLEAPPKPCSVSATFDDAICACRLPSSLVMLAPYVNSYRRLTPDMAAPVNNAWGYDNRTTAFRVPVSDAAARRVERLDRDALGRRERIGFCVVRCGSCRRG